MEDKLECPYCGSEKCIDYGDGHGCSDGVVYEDECNECGKAFTFTTSISRYHYTEKADCLNDGEHQFFASTTAPTIFTKMRCKTCTAEREPTTQEWIEIYTKKLEWEKKRCQSIK